MDVVALRIGLTGGIGSGKSAAAQALQRLGAALIDTDAIAHELTAAGGEAVAALSARFGSACLDAAGALDRRWMRERAFSDPTVLRTLEAILHPLIGSTAERRARDASGAACIVFDVPLLVETGSWRRRVDRVLVIDCSEATQARRVAARPGSSEAHAQRVIARQATRAARRAAADAVIDNEREGLAGLHENVARLWDTWLATRT
ncbi:MAG TPA: dephospho-CoA kinase [Methylibium sp.]|nr:dephospho-CoA kinase [Methylibium sp.]